MVVEGSADAVFVIDRIAEPQPSPEALLRYPDDLGKVDGVPWFIAYRRYLRHARQEAVRPK